VIVVGKIGRTFKDARRPADSIAAARGQKKVSGTWIAQQSSVEGRDHDGRKILIDVVTNILRRDGTVSGQDQHHFRSRSLFKLDNNRMVNWFYEDYNIIEGSDYIIFYVT
jgi:hypothetical protein